MAKKQKSLHPDAPLLHADHPRPVTRRDFLRQGLISGGAVVTAGSLFNTLLPGTANALSADVLAMDTGSNCVVGASGALKLPFICFDLAGGANLVGSNAMVGGPGGQLDTAAISTQGFSRLGLPGDRLPDPSTPGLNTDSTLGLVFHSESALLAGMLDRMSPAAAAKTNGAVIPARSDNDTGNNPHNPMYGIAQVGASGGLLTLIGSQSSESGGRSISAGGYDETTANIFINTEIRPTKIDRPSDVTGLIDTGDLLAILNQPDATSVVEAVARISNAQIAGVQGGFANAADNTALQQLLRCSYVKSADIVENYADPQALNPALDPLIVGAGGIFTQAEFDGEREFRKVSSVMKLVVGTDAGAGTVAMGGYDYHTGNRVAGERRDIRAGRCIGAAIEYAHRIGRPLMVYVFSDGSVFSNGTPDNNAVTDGNITLQGGKGQWTGDNSGGAASLMFVYDPRATGRPTIRGGTVAEQAARQQLGYYRTNGSVETSARTTSGFPILAANNVNSLVETVLLNYIGCHNPSDAAAIAEFNSKFPNHSLGSDAALAEMLIFNSLPSISAGQILTAQPG